MKKVLYVALFISLMVVETVLASENISLSVEMPEKITVGENFRIEVYINLNRNISGFECSINTPIYGGEYIQFINAIENEEIKEKAGEFYQLNLTNKSVFISFALFSKPINSDFHLITVEGKGLKEGVVPIKFDAKASDENGINTIKLSPITYNLEIVSSDDQNNYEERKSDNNEVKISNDNQNKDNEKREDEENIFIKIIKAILNFFKMIFGI